MADGRMLNRSVATDERLNQLSHEAMLLYLMTVPHLDRDGLVDGRARVLWAMVAPLQDAWIQRAGALIDEWVAAGLVVRFDDDRQPVLFFPGFAKNQPRMVYNRERVSRFACPPGFVRTAHGLKSEDEASVCDEVAQTSRLGRAHADSNDTSARDLIAQNSRPGRAEDQDQDQTEVVVDGVFTNPPHATGIGNEGVRGSFSQPDGAAPTGIQANGHVSAGELQYMFTDDQLRMATYQLGSVLGLHTEWTGFERYLARQPTGVLLVLLEWIQFYSEMPPAGLDKIQSLPALIQSNINKGTRAPLNGVQRRHLAMAIEHAVNVLEEI